MTENEKIPSTDIEFATIATQLQNGNYEATFTKLTANYVAKIAAMKMTQPMEIVHAAMMMGQWFLIETAQHMFSLTYDEAITVVRTNIYAARQAIKHTA